MAAPTEAQAQHLELLDKLDTHAVHKTFRSASWKPNQRRNKNLKAIVGDAAKRENSAMATPQDGSGNVTPGADDGLSTSGVTTPASSNGKEQPNLAQASQSLSKLVLEKSLKPAGLPGTVPSATYTNIESAPSLAHAKRYCDVTGLPAPYFDPKSRMRYHNKEIFGFVRSLPQTTAEMYLEARGAHTILK